MQVYIYTQPVKRRVWAINELGSMVVFGGPANKLQQREVDCTEWPVAATRKMGEGYRFVCDLNLGSDEQFIEPAHMLDAISIFRELYYRDAEKSALGQFSQEAVREVCEWLSEKPIFAASGDVSNMILAASNWLEGHTTLTITPPGITLSGGQGCYF